tara:strand:- start:342 stop:1130 length:789 start_codon:yes stop_codon:yes gene_type:complete
MSELIKNNHTFNRDVTIPSTSKLLLDGGGDTYIAESSANVLTMTAGSNTVFSATGLTDTNIVAQRSIVLAPMQNGLSGRVNISGDTALSATKKLYFDGGGDTYIHEKSADFLQIVSGGDAIVNFVENGSNGNLVDFTTAAAGFTQHEPSYGATNTDVEFRTLGNKGFFTFGAGSVTNARLYFPSVSCSCTLVVKQDGTGSRTITNWNAYDSAGNAAAGSSTVKWAGGSAPTLSTGANAIDIISFYWDKDNEVAYGVASLNFS